jgi:hypothetical protein
MGYIYKRKSEAFDKFKAFKALVENEIDLKNKCLRSYKGGDFISNEFEEFGELHGIKRHLFSCKNSIGEWSGRNEKSYCIIDG